MPGTSRHTVKEEFLLEKGIDLMWANGYNGTSVNDIVKAADIPKGSFYFYFKSKEDFAVKAITQYFLSQMPEVELILNDEAVSPKQRLINFFEYKLKVLKEEQGCKMGCMAANLGNEMSEHSEEIRKVIAEFEAMMKTQLAEIYKAAQDKGEIKNEASAEDVVDFIMSAGKGAMINMKNMCSSYPIENFVNMVKSVLLK